MSGALIGRDLDARMGVKIRWREGPGCECGENADGRGAVPRGRRMSTTTRERAVGC